MTGERSPSTEPPLTPIADNQAADNRDGASARVRMLLVFGVASLLAVGLGAMIMAQDDLPPSLWLRNPVAWLIAAGVGVFLAQRGWIAIVAAPLALVLVALSLAGPGQHGVHRWIELGPVQLNAAAIVLPAAIAAFHLTRAWLAVACFALIAGVLAWQPDISQLAAFSLAAVILCGARFGPRGALAALVVAVAALAYCLPKPDPLLPVAHVEEIFRLAAERSPALAIAMAASLAAAVFAPFLLWSDHRLRWPAVALAAYFAVSALAFLFGAYPVPLAGYGLSFVIGWWLGIAALSFPSRTPSA